MRYSLFAVAIVLAACKDDRPRDVASSSFVENGIAVKSRRASVMNGKVAWGALVVDESDRSVRSAYVEVVVRGKGGAEIGRAKRRIVGEGSGLLELPPRYGVRVEVNGVDVQGAPERVDAKLVDVELARNGDTPPTWKPAQVVWKRPLPEGVSFAIEEDKGCGTVLGMHGQPATFGCTLGIRNTGTRAVQAIALRFEPARGGDPIEVGPPQGTDLPLEPGDAVVFHAASVVKKPSEMILTGTVTDGRGSGAR